MTTQIELGEWLKAKGIAQVTAHTKEEWKSLFRLHALEILHSTGSVTSSEVLAIIGPPPNHPNATGAAMHALATEFKLVCQYEKSDRAPRHRAIIGRWFWPTHEN